MFCQNCGKKNPNGAAFCNYCGANLTKKSSPTIARNIQLKENEIRLLQKKFNDEASHREAVILAIGGFLAIVIFGYASTISAGAGIGVIVGLGALYQAWKLDNSRLKAANETEIKLKAAEAELEKMKHAQ
jgi:hypothetical protein